MNGWTFSQNLCKQGKTHHHSECRDHLFMVQLLQLSSSCHKHLSVRGSDSPFSQLQWFWSQSGVRRWFSSNPTVACVVRARQLSLSFTHSFAAFGEFPHGQCYFVVVVIGFFLACNDSGRMFDKSFPVSTFFCCCCFFFLVEITSRTLIPLFRPGSVYSGSASWDNCDWVFPDELHVNSFSDRFPHYT